MEETGPTELRDPVVYEYIAERMELYNKISNCNVQLMVSGYLYKEWSAQWSLERTKVAHNFANAPLEFDFGLI